MTKNVQNILKKSKWKLIEGSDIQVHEYKQGGGVVHGTVPKQGGIVAKGGGTLLKWCSTSLTWCSTVPKQGG